MQYCNITRESRSPETAPKKTFPAKSFDCRKIVVSLQAKSKELYNERRQIFALHKGSGASRL